MKLNIISLRGLEFEGEVTSVNLKTTSGEITILDNHLPIITQLSKGRAVVIKEDGAKSDFEINSGFLEVRDNNQATLLVS